MFSHIYIWFPLHLGFVKEWSRSEAVMHVGQVQDDFEQEDEAEEKEEGDELASQSLTYTVSVMKGDYTLLCAP